jgi:outer membrane protein OmpA-like peptidoglycan-associated protein
LVRAPAVHHSPDSQSRLATPSGAQGGLIDRVKAKAKEKVDAASDSLTDAALDKASGAVKCGSTNVNCIKKAFGAGKNVKLVDAKGNAVPSTDSAKAVASAGGVPANVIAANTAAASAAPAAAASDPATSAPPAATAQDTTPFVNYDFVPGDKVLFAEDFSTDKVGDLPGRIKVLSGNVEVADYMGQRFLRATSDTHFMIPLAARLPDKFTLEFDAIHTWGWATDVHFTDADHSDGLNYATFGSSSGIGEFTSSPSVDKSSQLYHARIMGDGDHVKVYVDGKRVANVPTANLSRANGVWIDGPASDDNPFYITNIRLAASDKTLFDALSATGRASTHGILFATNSDAIRPESAPTLQAIGDMLQQHADLKLVIEGHTDNVGAAAANQSLSERRAAAVRQALIAAYHIDAARLTSKGYGATKPVASNDTPEGRQQNRRVELVKN